MSQTVLVLGEVCQDIYLHTKHTRQSPEDPTVPVYKVQETDVRQGMSFNVLNNVKAIGLDGILLDDKSGITKTRLFKDGKQICRIDNDSPARNLTEDEVLSNLRHLSRVVDAVIVEDYGKGFFTPRIYQAVFTMFHRTFVDTSPFIKFENYRNCFLLKPNLIEAQKATGEVELDKIFDKLFQMTDAEFIVVTAGEMGMYMSLKYDRNILHHPALSKNVVDVTGCGDTTIAALTYSFLTGKTLKDTLEFSSKAAAVCVEKPYVYAPSLEEINTYGQRT